MTNTLNHHKVTPDRKHYTQLTREEIDRIQTRFQEIARKLTYCQHAIDQLNFKGIQPSDITLRGRLIEFARCNTDGRILLRQDNGVCLVISLTTARIITVFRNNGKDNHETLDWTQYNGTVEVTW